MNAIRNRCILLGPIGIAAVLVSWGLRADEPVRTSITGVAHVAVYARDLEQSRVFYKDFLGYAEPFSLTNNDGSVLLTFIKVNDRQYIELFPERQAGSDRLSHISIETDDARGLRESLAGGGVEVPREVARGRIGNLNFNLTDPDGHPVEITQYMPDGWSVREKGKWLPETRISTRLMHVGILVTNLDSAMAFYRGVLGFEETWRGGRTTNLLNWVNMKVPDGSDYVEFMLELKLPEPGKRGVAHHICLEVSDVEKAKALLESRAARLRYTRPMQILTGINRKRQLNLYDPDGTRVELMEPRRVDDKGDE